MNHPLLVGRSLSLQLSRPHSSGPSPPHPAAEVLRRAVAAQSAGRDQSIDQSVEAGSFLVDTRGGPGASYNQAILSQATNALETDSAVMLTLRVTLVALRAERSESADRADRGGSAGSSGGGAGDVDSRFSRMSQYRDAASFPVTQDVGGSPSPRLSQLGPFGAPHAHPLALGGAYGDHQRPSARGGPAVMEGSSSMSSMLPPMRTTPYADRRELTPAVLELSHSAHNWSRREAVLHRLIAPLLAGKPSGESRSRALAVAALLFDELWGAARTEAVQSSAAPLNAVEFKMWRAGLSAASSSVQSGIVAGAVAEDPPYLRTVLTLLLALLRHWRLSLVSDLIDSRGRSPLSSEPEDPNAPLHSLTPSGGVSSVTLIGASRVPAREAVLLFLTPQWAAAFSSKATTASLLLSSAGGLSAAAGDPLVRELSPDSSATRAAAAQQAADTREALWVEFEQAWSAEAWASWSPAGLRVRREALADQARRRREGSAARLSQDESRLAWCEIGRELGEAGLLFATFLGPFENHRHFWEIDPVETVSRTRPRMRRNYNGSAHLEASDGWQQKRSGAGARLSATGGGSGTVARLSATGGGGGGDSAAGGGSAATVARLSVSGSSGGAGGVSSTGGGNAATVARLSSSGSAAPRLSSSFGSSAPLSLSPSPLKAAEASAAGTHVGFQLQLKVEVPPTPGKLGLGPLSATVAPSPTLSSADQPWPPPMRTGPLDGHGLSVPQTPVGFSITGSMTGDALEGPRPGPPRRAPSRLTPTVDPTKEESKEMKRKSVAFAVAQASRSPPHLSSLPCLSTATRVLSCAHSALFVCPHLDTACRSPLTRPSIICPSSDRGPVGLRD